MSEFKRTHSIAAILVAAIVCAPAPAFGADTPAEIYTLGANFFRHSRWEPACEEFQRLLKEAPEHPLADDARFYLGESLVRAGRHGEAADVWLTYLKTPHEASRTALARFRAGESCYLAGRKNDARSELEQFFEEPAGAPVVPRALVYLGNIAATDGDFAAAAGYFGRLTAAYPDDELYNQALLGQAQALLRSGDAVGAWTVVRSLYESSEASPDIADATWIAAEALERLGRNAEALAAAKQFLGICSENDPRRFEALIMSARALERTSRLEDAEKIYERIVADFPKHSQRDAALYEWAWALKQLGRPQEAAAKFSQLTVDIPGSPLAADAWYRLAEYELAQRRPQQAAAKLESAAKSAGPELLPHVLLLRSQALMAAQDYPAAEAAIDALVRSFPQHALAKQASFWKAEIAFQAGDWNQAADRFAALAAAPANQSETWYGTARLRQVQALAEARQWDAVLASAAAGVTAAPSLSYEFDFLAGRAHAARAEFREARVAYTRVLGNDRARGTETAALSQFLIAETYFHQRDFETALREYLRVDALHTAWQAAALLQAGKCQEQLGRFADARRCYDQLLAQHPSSPYSAEAGRRRDAAMQQAEAANGVQRK